MPSGMEMINLAMRASAFLWSLLVMALTGNMIDQWNRGNGGEVNYSLFVSIFGMLSLIYLIPASLGKFVIHPILPLVLDVLNLIFWFAGAVALAAGLNAHSCNNQNYLDNNHITQGSEKRCREGQASCAFLWFGFAAFVVSTALSAMGMKSGGGARSGGIKRGPAMSQV